MSTLKKSMRLAGIGAMALFMVSCASTPVQFGQVAAAQTYDNTHTRTISAKRCGFQLLLFIPIQTNSRQARAFQALQNQANGDYLTDIKDRESWFYGLIGTGYCTELSATAHPRL